MDERMVTKPVFMVVDQAVIDELLGYWLIADYKMGDAKNASEELAS